MSRGEPAFDVAVVGGGILGLATAHQLLAGDPRRRIVVLEKEGRVGLHQSTHNSGVLHAGVYYAPGSLKARLCAQGKRMMESFASEHGIP
ncbi:MAG: FAD-dependent oxidoreductase, partial [Acidimicrobiia bacterium]